MRQRNATQWLFGAFLTAAAMAASGEVRLDLQACGGVVPNVPCDAYTVTIPDGTHVENAISYQGSYAAGLADLPTGTLRATARSANDLSGVSTSATAVLGDTVSFSGGFGETGYLNYLFQGSITEVPNPLTNTSFAGLTFYIASPNGARTYGLALSTPDGCPALNFANSSLGCYEGSSINLSGSVPFEILSGSFYFLNALGAVASAGDFVEFGNSAHFSFTLPVGVSYTSQTGQFLTASVVAPVPEPTTIVLFGVGLVALGWLQRHHLRRRKPLTVPKAPL